MDTSEQLRQARTSYTPPAPFTWTMLLGPLFESLAPRRYILPIFIAQMYRRSLVCCETVRLSWRGPLTRSFPIGDKNEAAGAAVATVFAFE